MERTLKQFVCSINAILPTYFRLTCFSFSFFFKIKKNVSCYFFLFFYSLLSIPRDRMSAVECLEHKWLSESSQPLKNFTKEDSTIAEITTTVVAVTAADATENTIPIEKHNNSTVENYSNETTIDTNKSREVDSVSCATSSSSSSPAKPNTGFFLHQTPKNGTALDEVLFSSLNNGFNMTANTNTSTNGVFKSNHHHHLHQHQHQHHSHSHSHHNHQSVVDQHAKQNASSTVNNSCSINPNDTTDLLKDYATNKENINLSKILANRSSANQLINGNRINSSNSNSNSTTSNSDYVVVDEHSLATMSATSVTSAQAKQHETVHVLFPDAPTTPKVLRKSNQTDSETPSCVTLVKQYQLNNGTSLTETAPPQPMSSSATSATTMQSPATTMRNKFANLTELACENYRISATAIATATATTNGHHHHHHSLGSSALSSALSINTLTESSVGVSQQHSNSTITMNCLCGADKTANCCCNSSSRAALNYRKKSLAVVDSSILC